LAARAFFEGGGRLAARAEGLETRWWLIATGSPAVWPLILFVALNEKKRIVATMRAYYDEARSWE
jgi:hypothetical protein